MSRPKKPLLSDDHALELADLFRLLGDASRLKIVVACLKKPLAVSDIADKLGLSVSLVSHHLRLLREAGLIETEKRGIWAYYWATDKGKKVLAAVTDLVKS